MMILAFPWVLSLVRGCFCKATILLSLSFLYGCAQHYQKDPGAFVVDSPKEFPRLKVKKKPESFQNLVKALIKNDRNYNTFHYRGSFRVVQRRNLPVQLPMETLAIDVFRPETNFASPLVVIAHGNKSRKEAHSLQARHLASWGITAITVQLPDRKEWLDNGVRLRNLLDYVEKSKHPDLQRIDANQTILMGHSFGGSAIAIASSNNPRVRGLIFLDPAVVHDAVRDHLRRVTQPAVVIGADREFFMSKKRRFFYSYLSGPTAEFSIANSTHDDAQMPSMFSLHALGVDPEVKSGRQMTFLSSATAAALSMLGFGSLDYAIDSYKVGLNEGEFKNFRSR